MKNKFQNTLYILILCSICSYSQEINNNLFGFYADFRESDTNIGFEFDGNGKVNLMGETSGDYFTVGDMLILFTDEENFRFKVQKNKLIGLSNNIKKLIWTKRKSKIRNNRTNNVEAKKIALLMNDYYKIMGIWSLNHLSKAYKYDFKKPELGMLCANGLPLACLSEFKLKIADELHLDTFNPRDSTSKPNPEDLDVIRDARNIIANKDYRVYFYLGLYYYKLGQKEKAMQQWKLGAEKGDKKSSLELINLKMENDPENIQPSAQAPTQDKKQF